MFVDMSALVQEQVIVLIVRLLVIYWYFTSNLLIFY